MKNIEFAFDVPTHCDSCGSKLSKEHECLVCKRDVRVMMFLDWIEQNSGSWSDRDRVRDVLHEASQVLHGKVDR